jgi:hypothetical protein
MPPWTCNVGGRSHTFGSLRELMAKATPHRSGDVLAGVAASSSEERVAAQHCLAEVPLRRFLEDPLVPYEDRRGQPPYHRYARRRGVCAGLIPRRGGIQGLAPALRDRRPPPGRPRPGPHARDGRGRLETHGQPGPDPCRAEAPGRDGIPGHAGPPGPSRRPPPAQPPHGLPEGDRGLDRRRPPLRLRRRGHRDQSRHGQRVGGRGPPPADRRTHQPLRDPDAIVRAGPCDDPAGGDAQGGARRPGLPVHRRHRGRERLLRRQPLRPFRGARRRRSGSAGEP